MKRFDCAFARAAFLALAVIAFHSPSVHAADASAGMESMDVGAREKTLANGLYLSQFTASYSGSTLTLTVDINNDSSTRTSGTLRLEYWATTATPARGEGFVGYRLGISSTISPLATNSQYLGLVRVISPYTPPPDGTYTMVLLLTEFDSVNCPAADHFCLIDSLSADQVRVWVGGFPQNPPTTTSALENPASGSFQSGIGLISGWSCQGPVTVSVDGVSVSAPTAALAATRRASAPEIRAPASAFS